MLIEKVNLNTENKRTLERNGMNFAKLFHGLTAKESIILAVIERLFLFRENFKIIGIQFLHKKIHSLSSGNRESFPNLFEILSIIQNYESPISSLFEVIERTEFTQELQALSNSIPNLEALSEDINIEIVFLQEQNKTETINCSNYLTQLRITLLIYEGNHYICYSDPLKPIYPNIIQSNLVDLKSQYFLELIQNVSEILVQNNCELKDIKRVKKNLKFLPPNFPGKAIFQLTAKNPEKKNAKTFDVFDSKNSEKIDLKLIGLRHCTDLINSGSARLEAKSFTNVDIPDLSFTQQTVPYEDSESSIESILQLFHSISSIGPY